MTKRSLWIPIMLAAGAGVVLAVAVSTDYDHSVDFAGYHTYSWLKIQAPDSIWEDASGMPWILNSAARGLPYNPPTGRPPWRPSVRLTPNRGWKQFMPEQDQQPADLSSQDDRPIFIPEGQQFVAGHGALSIGQGIPRNAALA